MATKTTPEDDATDAAALGRQIKAIQADVASLTDTLKQFGAAQAGHVADVVGKAVGQAGDTMRSTAAEARRRGEIAAEEVEQIITRNPFTSILVALGLGYIIGFISRR